MKTILISQATPAQIKRFAQMVGVDLAPTDGDDTILAKLKRVWNSDGISVAEDEPADAAIAGDMRVAPEDRAPGESSAFAQVAGAKRLDSADTRSDPRVIMTVQKPRIGNDVSKMQNYVPVGVNGVAFQIATGVKVDVPYRVYEALNNAMRNEITHDDNGEVVEVEVHAFPFNVHEMPSRAEREKWLETFAGAELV